MKSKKNSTKSRAARQPFTSEEDRRLIEIMSKVETMKWSQVSSMLGGGKNARQCRDRWVNYLSPNIKKEDWTEEEDFVIIQSYQNFGSKWAKIATFLHGRSENHIKNRWHSFLKRRFEYESYLTTNQIRNLVHEIHRKQQLENPKYFVPDVMFKRQQEEKPSQPETPPNIEPPPPPPSPPVQVAVPQARPPRAPPKSMSPATALVQIFKHKDKAPVNLFTDNHPFHMYGFLE